MYRPAQDFPNRSTNHHTLRAIEQRHPTSIGLYLALLHRIGSGMGLKIFQIVIKYPGSIRELDSVDLPRITPRASGGGRMVIGDRGLRLWIGARSAETGVANLPMFRHHISKHPPSTYIDMVGFGDHLI